ncbi:hypothetical protein SLEP1_g8297 [Rubroshorea leprosula]|uniref:Transcriptional coactivator Hfi1/Transcriptional adapter 1 n=1 Tax=Rubroshorea leprosula TaxID=152421 RepID=A0AAV5I769_9ROSI|nr:hypothetical protein SLEP1_g8297 [Rubroshorea leprosula]
MIVRNSETAMSEGRHFSRVDTLEIKSQIERKLGRLKAEKYFNLLARYLSLKICKSEFDKLCIGTIGRENVRLHNNLLRSIVRNATLARTPPSKESKVEGSLSVKVPNGFQRSSLQSLCKDFPQSPRRGRTPNLRDRKFRDRPSPLGPHGKSHSTACEDAVAKVQEQQSATELLSLGSRPPGSVEDGEEVDQAAGSPSIYSRSHVRAPLGIIFNAKAIRKVPSTGFSSSYYTETCHNRGELPDTSSLRKRLEQKLAMEGLKMSVDCANLMNNSLDIFLKRLIKPCLEVGGSRSGHILLDQRHTYSIPCSSGTLSGVCAQKPRGLVSASMLDFRVAMELNPLILGEDWPTQMEKVCLRASEGEDEAN